MSRSYGWKPGPLIFGTDAERRTEATERGLTAEKFAVDQLTAHGFKIEEGTAGAGADIVAVDEHGQEFSIEVKSPRRQGARSQLFVTNARAPVDVHLFVEPTLDKVWVVPAQVVRERGDVLKPDDISEFEGAWSSFADLRQPKD